MITSTYYIYDFQGRKHCEKSMPYLDVNKRLRFKCRHETKQSTKVVDMPKAAH